MLWWSFGQRGSLSFDDAAAPRRQRPVMATHSPFVRLERQRQDTSDRYGGDAGTPVTLRGQHFNAADGEGMLPSEVTQIR